MADPLKADTDMGIQTDKLSLKEKISFGGGDLASNFAWGMIGSYLLFFYTDVFGLTASAAGTLFLVARVWDAVNDPIMGVIVDKTRSKHGKARPYLLYLAIPFGILSIITFITPDISYTGKLIYAYATYISLGMMYTAINLPYGALLPMMTQDSYEKTQLGSFRTIGLGIGQVIVAVLTLPLVSLLGNGNQQIGFPLTMVLFAIVSTVLFLNVFKNCKERFSNYQQKNKENPIKSMKRMLKNKPWSMVGLSALFQFFRLGLVNTVIIYLSEYVLQQPALTPILLGLGNGGSILGGLVASPILKRTGNRNGAIAVLIISSIAFILLLLSEEHLILFSALLFIAYSVAGIASPAIFAMLADSVDYHEWKFGVRPEGLLFSVYSFATKFGMAIGSAIVGYALAWTGYVPDEITDATQSAIRIVFYGGGILFTVAQFIPLIFYKLDKYHKQILQDLRGC